MELCTRPSFKSEVSQGWCSLRCDSVLYTRVFRIDGDYYFSTTNRIDIQKQIILRYRKIEEAVLSAQLDFGV